MSKFWQHALFPLIQPVFTCLGWLAKPRQVCCTVFVYAALEAQPRRVVPKGYLSLGSEWTFVCTSCVPGGLVFELSTSGVWTFFSKGRGLPTHFTSWRKYSL